MRSSNRGMTVIIIMAVVLILGVRYFLSNREVVTEEDVRDKIEAAVEATNTAFVVQATVAPESTSAGNILVSTRMVSGVNSTIAAQETRIAELVATNDAQAAATAIPTATPTDPSASGAIRIQRTADALMLTVAAQGTEITALQATNQAEEPTIVPTRTPIPTMVIPTAIPTVTIEPPTSIPTIENTPLPPTSAPTVEPQVFHSVDYPGVVRHQEWLTSDLMALAPDNSRILTISDINGTYIYDVTTGEELHRLWGIVQNESAAAWSPDSQFAAVGDFQGRIVVWDAATGQSVFERHSIRVNSIYKLAWSPDGTYLAAISRYELNIWNTATWELIYSEEVISGVSLAWSPDSQSLLYADTITISRLSLADTIVSVGVWITHNEEIVDIDWSPDGQWLAVVDESHRINVYNVADSTLVHSMRGHRDNINSVQWAADSVYLLTASDDKTVRIWNGSTGAAAFVLDINDRFDYLLSQANWTSDGEFIVINASDVLFWPNPLMNGAATDD